MVFKEQDLVLISLVYHRLTEVLNYDHAHISDGI